MPERSDDEVYPDAVRVVEEFECASIAHVQRVCRIGWNQARRLLERMVADDVGVIQHRALEGLFEFVKKTP
jgi:DNA segregation ATPase FtsK/SpoIIIE-like protein